MTPAEVIAELERRGYATTSRRLIDWRQKGLLPPLVKHGRGQGRGWVYVWEDPLVVEQAIAVQELLWLHGHTEWLYLPLWCLGFTVPLNQVRPQLLTMVEAYLEHLTGGMTEPEDVSDRLSQLAIADLTRSARTRSGRPTLSPEAVEYGLNLLAGGTAYVPDREALAGIARSAGALTGNGQRRGAPKGRRLSAAELRHIRRWTKRHASLPLLHDAEANATEQEFAQVHADWRALAQLKRAIGDVVDNEAWEEFNLFALRVIVATGPWLTLLDLSMRRSGLAVTLDRFQATLADYAHDVETNPETRARLPLVLEGGDDTNDGTTI